MKRRLTAILILLLAAASSRPPVVWGVAPNIDLSPPAFVPPDAERTVLSNGVVVYLRENHELPIVDIQIWFKTSPLDETPSHALRLFGPVWRSGGTLTRKPDALDDELESLAVKVETGADYESAGCSLSCLSRDITKALDLWADILLHPAFDAGRLSLEKGEQIEEIRRRNDTPQKIGRRAFRRVIYGPDHPYAKSPQPADVTRVSRADLQKIHRTVVVPQTAIIAAAGDFDSKELLEGLEKRFAGWTAGPPRQLNFDYSIKKPAEGTIFLVEKDSPQTRLSIGQVGISRLDPDRFAVTVGDYVFGGGGPSRLFGEIRSRLGLAYMVGSFVFDPTGPGMIGVVCQSKVQSTVAVTEAILKEMKKFSSEPISDEELALAKSAILNAHVFSYDTPFEIATAHAQREFFGYEPDDLKLYSRRISAVTKDDVFRVAKKYYSPDSAKIVIVGDSKNFDGSLDKLGPVTKIPLDDLK